MQNSLCENQEILLRDLKSINKDMSIDSYNGPMVIDVLLYLLTHDLWMYMYYDKTYSILLDLENSLGAKKTHDINTLVSSMYDTMKLFP